MLSLHDSNSAVFIANNPKVWQFTVSYQWGAGKFYLCNHDSGKVFWEITLELSVFLYSYRDYIWLVKLAHIGFI